MEVKATRRLCARRTRQLQAAETRINLLGACFRTGPDRLETAFEREGPNLVSADRGQRCVRGNRMRQSLDIRRSLAKPHHFLVRLDRASARESALGGLRLC